MLSDMEWKCLGLCPTGVLTELEQHIVPIFINVCSLGWLQELITRVPLAPGILWPGLGSSRLIHLNILMTERFLRMLLLVLKLGEFQAIGTSGLLLPTHLACLASHQSSSESRATELGSTSDVRHGKNAMTIFTTHHIKEALSMWKIHILERNTHYGKAVFPVTMHI